MKNTITTDDNEYIKADTLEPAPWQIVVATGRWNLVGTVTANTDGSIVITNASVIRYWGTTKGLGELAANGKTTKTILDPIGTVRVPAHALILTIDSEESKWQ